MTISSSTQALIRHLEDANAKLGYDTGACLITLPEESTPHCAELTKQQCEDVGGVFIGGPCLKD